MQRGTARRATARSGTARRTTARSGAAQRGAARRGVATKNLGALLRFGAARAVVAPFLQSRGLVSRGSWQSTRNQRRVHKKDAFTRQRCLIASYLESHPVSRHTRTPRQGCEHPVACGRIPRSGAKPTWPQKPRGKTPGAAHVSTDADPSSSGVGRCWGTAPVLSLPGGPRASAGSANAAGPSRGESRGESRGLRAAAATRPPPQKAC